jgi:hypothetical protein
MAALPGDGAAAGDVNGPAQLDLDGAAPVGARSFAPHQAHPAEALDIGIPAQRKAECAPALEACVAAAVEGDPACTLHLNLRSFYLVPAHNLRSFYLVPPIFNPLDLMKWRALIISERRKISLYL